MTTEQQTGNPQLIQRIRAEIDRMPGKAISFARFMQLCLYEPEHGYYMSERVKIGKEGDFYTSSSVGTIMGEMLAKYCADLIAQYYAHEDVVELVEWGGGNGRLARQMLDELKLSFPNAYRVIRYVSIEESDMHRSLQEKALGDHLERVQWLAANEWLSNQHDTATIVYSNELLDAFPVYRIVRQHDSLYEIVVGWHEQEGRFIEKRVPLLDERLLHYIETEKVSLQDGQQAEINLEAIQWVEQVGGAMQRGVLITIDYGALAEEIYASHRMNGTLLCYRNHQAYDEPFIYVGEQDITAHVNFSACINAGRKVGFDEWSFVDQKTFLIEAGILEKLKDHSSGDPFHPSAKINRTIRQILWSDRMSELFKVLVQFKCLRVHPEEGPESET